MRADFQCVRPEESALMLLAQCEVLNVLSSSGTPFVHHTALSAADLSGRV